MRPSANVVAGRHLRAVLTWAAWRQLSCGSVETYCERTGRPADGLIIGVSCGIGYALAEAYLGQDASVLGINRRPPERLGDHAAFSFSSADLADEAAVAEAVMWLVDGVARVDLAILNAGVLSRFTDMAEVGLAELRRVMDVNLWANKTVLDALFEAGCDVRQVVTMSSGASVNGNRGWNGYSISKAALNMF